MSKRMQQLVKSVHRFLITCATLLRFASRFVWEACGYGIAALFAKRAAIRETCHTFTAKDAKILGLGRSKARWPPK